MWSSRGLWGSGIGLRECVEERIADWMGLICWKVWLVDVISQCRQRNSFRRIEETYIYFSYQNYDCSATFWYCLCQIPQSHSLFVILAQLHPEPFEDFRVEAPSWPKFREIIFQSVESFLYTCFQIGKIEGIEVLSLCICDLYMTLVVLLATFL